MSDQPTFIHRLPEEAVAGYAAVAPAGPLAGLTFAIKDNIDLAGVPTTAADPRRTTPAGESATVVQRLLDAGAVPVGKTNMDQYATGLVGTRSPYGACHSVYSPDHVSGGSSSGSAVAVAAGEAEFALATDTAGSGRVPAAFNGLVGVKPSKGLVPTTGVVPACASLDCVTVMARTVARGREVLDVIAGPDPRDPWSRTLEQRATPARPVVAVPVGDLDLDPVHHAAWEASTARARELWDVVEVDVTAFLEAATLLYGGPWVAERRLAFGDVLTDDPAVDPTVRTIVADGPDLSAVDAFAAFHRLASLDAATRPVWTGADALLLPVTATHPTLEEVAADPVGVNTRLGRFTNMTNLLDLCAVAFPGPVRGDGLPFGVQLLAPAGGDLALLDLAARWCGEQPARPAGDGRVDLVVAGAHLAGEPLNADLVARGGTFVRTARMAPDYRMYVVDGPLPRPGVTRLPAGGVAEPSALEVEVWSLPAVALAGFQATIAPPLGLGQVDLDDGTRVLGFLCSGDGVDPARDITAHGGWRAWRASTG
ncbi:allophanate hydrolase [Nocardioides jiangxiensis]|uniref:Allophanate hydrolase n=1 Tax=Nocardioides jiangxiensis TaxID=3064524 RepID=A0ABT9B2N9_9ACTN|nr:allophanate hydrolase [Nocardioides sp. WY-20]MDO7868650.1 allophanate hydrolase [Nocardioides sp. WY-20]